MTLSKALINVSSLNVSLHFLHKRGYFYCTVLLLLITKARVQCATKEKRVISKSYFIDHCFKIIQEVPPLNKNEIKKFFPVRRDKRTQHNTAYTRNKELTLTGTTQDVNTHTCFSDKV
jgi:hypothetical protein